MIAFILQSDWESAGTILIRRLAAAGHELSVFIRSGQKGADGVLADLPAEATLARSLGEAVADADTVLTLLSTPQEVEDIYLDKGGLFESVAPESLLIDLSTSNPRLAKELYALAMVHDHRFVEAPLEGSVEMGGFRLYAAGEPDCLERALPILHVLTPQVIDAGLPGSGVTLKLASQIALANALMGLVEAIAFATLAGVEGSRVLEALEGSAAASAVAQAFGQRILDEEFVYGYDLQLFYNDLAAALDAADEFDLALPGLETAHQLYDLLVLVGGGNKGIHALALIYCDEARCAAHGLNWELAQRAMDIYERANETAGSGYDDEYDYDYDYDEEECDDPGCSHPHHTRPYPPDDLPSMGDYFSSN
jgi:3-hydroxyisobutyrate dehydrogenase